MCEEIWGNTESQTEDDSASADLYQRFAILRFAILRRD